MAEGEKKDEKRKDFAERATVGVGFPNVWNPVFQHFEPFFIAADNLTALHNHVLSVPVSGQAQDIIGLIVKTMSNDYGAVLALVLNGYGVQAMKIARSMFEAECNVHYLKTSSEGVEDYIDFEPITRKRLYDLMSPDRQAALGADVIESVKTDYAAAAPRFVKNNKGELRDNWCRVSLYQRAKGAGLEELYERAYAFATSMHHYDFHAIAASMDREAEEVAIAPSGRWLGEALSTGHGAFVRSLKYYLDIANIGFQDEINAALDEFATANKTLIAAGELKMGGG